MYEKRQYCIDKFSKIFDLSELDSIVLNLEKGIFNETIKFCKEKKEELKWCNPAFLKKYAQLARKVLANITYTPNASMVKEKILDSTWKPEDIAKMSHKELHPEFHNEMKDKIMSKYINTKEEQEHDGFFKCGKCKTFKTTYTQAQTRSADEPMTTFVTCLNCNHRWKF